MKKLISLLIILTLLLTALVGCKKDGGENGGDTPNTDDGTFVIPEGLSGNDVIKLLLASQRLNSQLLKTEGDIFENGAEVMQTLASRARANLSSATYISTTHEAARGGKVEIDGDTFTWSGFVENCNSYDYFENITQNIVSSAERGAELIDNTKKYVRIVDKWVAIGEEKYYLHVDENSETIYMLRGDQLDICKRYKNESGKNVYELYTSYNSSETRMYYIPGERYEFTDQPKNDETGSTYFVADSSKGFWETLVIGEAPAHYNVSCFVMKNDICYDVLYDHVNGSILSLKTMSSDRKSDILFFMDNTDRDLISLHLGAFKGFDSVEITAAPDKVASSWDSDNEASVVYNSGPEEPYAATTGLESATVNLTNGNKIIADAAYANGNVKVQRVLVGYGSSVYTSELELIVLGESDEEIFANLKAFLDETGLKCRRDIDTILGGIRRAYVEFDSFIEYYKWNGNSVSTEESIRAATYVEDGKLANFAAMYDAVKNAEVIDFSDKDVVELNISFSPITVESYGSANFDTTTVRVSGLQLTVTDTTLYVENQAYIVTLALLKISGEGDNIIHLTTENPTEITYTETDSFTVGTLAATAYIPTLTAGEYTLVAYVATSDKIRASQYIPVVFTEINTEQTDLGNATLIPSKNDKNELILSFIENIDINVEFSSEAALDYAQLKELIATEAYKYGVASDTPIEKYDAETDSFSALAGDEAITESGLYRLAYSVQNGDVTLNGYIYAQYCAPEIEQ